MLRGWTFWCECYFNPCSPCGERLARRAARSSPGYFNPRSPCGERLAAQADKHGNTGISIHAPLAESDSARTRCPSISTHFNPRSPCGERLQHFQRDRSHTIFQSTLPLRRATKSWNDWQALAEISIHVPLAGSDGCFLGLLLAADISIHVPLVGSDGKAGRRCTVSTYFNPRSPCGERLDEGGGTTSTESFQSTLPLRGTTRARLFRRATVDFNPRSPCGERRAASGLRGLQAIISIHAPLAGRDLRI